MEIEMSRLNMVTGKVKRQFLTLFIFFNLIYFAEDLHIYVFHSHQ